MRFGRSLAVFSARSVDGVKAGRGNGVHRGPRRFESTPPRPREPGREPSGLLHQAARPRPAVTRRRASRPAIMESRLVAQAASLRPDLAHSLTSVSGPSSSPTPPFRTRARAGVRKHPGSSHSRDRRGRRFARPAHGADKCQPRPTLAKLPYGAVASRQGGKEGIYPINVAAAATRDACRQGGCGGTAAIATTTTTTIAQARSQQLVERRDSARGHGEEGDRRGAGEGMVVEGRVGEGVGG